MPGCCPRCGQSRPPWGGPRRQNRPPDCVRRQRRGYPEAASRALGSAEAKFERCWTPNDLNREWLSLYRSPRFGGPRTPNPPERTLDYCTCAQEAVSTKRRKNIGAPVASKTIGIPPSLTFCPVVVPLRGPGQSPVLPVACCARSLRFVGRCGRPGRFRVRPPPPLTPRPSPFAQQTRLPNSRLRSESLRKRGRAKGTALNTPSQKAPIQDYA